MHLKRLIKSILFAAVVLSARVSAAAEVDAAPPPGNPAEGRALFVGAKPFAKGGPPCGACHGMGGQGAGFGASYGPDLSETHAALGDDGVDAVLTDLPFPSMTPVYADRALEAEERAHLAAFLRAAGGQAPARETAAFALHGAGVASLLFAGLLLAGRSRLRRSAREDLIARAHGAHGGTP